MKPQEKPAAYDMLMQELRNTAVISSEFKNTIGLWVNAIQTEAYERGVVDGRRTASKKRKP